MSTPMSSRNRKSDDTSSPLAATQIKDDTMTGEECVLCRKLADLRQLPADEVVWEFPHSVALLGPWQYYPGYCILISRRHATELSQLPDELRRWHLEEMCLLARAIEQTFQPRKLNYELLGNQVPHLHW